MPHSRPSPDGMLLRSYSTGAVVCEPLASAVRGVCEQIHITPDDVVVVAGPGAMGLLSLQLAQRSQWYRYGHTR
jgi:threonine dehydrogenase-like Zn-dependent dehydrogenase